MSDGNGGRSKDKQTLTQLMGFDLDGLTVWSTGYGRTKYCKRYRGTEYGVSISYGNPHVTVQRELLFPFDSVICHSGPNYFNLKGVHEIHISPRSFHNLPKNTVLCTGSGVLYNTVLYPRTFYYLPSLPDLQKACHNPPVKNVPAGLP